jgi:glucokinase
MYLGIEIGGTKLQLVVGDDQARICERRRLNVAPACGAEGIRTQIAGALPDLIRAYELKAVGVGFGGPVNWRTGRIACSHQIAGWSDFDLAGWLAKLTGLPVRVDNDANVAALGEAVLGAGQKRNPVFYVTLGSGVGGGLVSTGEIYHGDLPGEAEVGHLRLDRTGATLESRCSGWAIDARIRDANARTPHGLLAKVCQNETSGEARHLAAALAQGDVAAGQILEELAGDLAFALSHVVHLFHPQVIVIGGGLSGVGEELRAAVAAQMRSYLMDVFLSGPELALAQLGEAAVPVGALRLACGAAFRFPA